MSSKSILIINRRPPYGRSNAREALDVALTCGVFEQPVSLLFLDDGILQLLRDQQGAAIEQKNLAANLGALPLYDIDRLYVAEASLQQHGLSDDQLILPVQTLNREAVQQLIRDHDLVLTF